ncbi:MAG: hypothetical protein H0T73_02830, partial [Ardenticatenales bacterium]|nr:hypothetical protein [Ardenticatenales bacterium]
MAEKSFQEQQLQRAVESLYEDERLRSNLTDDTATLALSWGERQLKAALPQNPADEEALQLQMETATTQVKKSLRTLNKLVSQRQELAEEELREKLVALLAEQGQESSALSGKVEALVPQSVTDEAFVAGLVALFEPGEAKAKEEVKEKDEEMPARALLAPPQETASTKQRMETGRLRKAEPEEPKENKGVGEAKKDSEESEERRGKKGTQNKGPLINYEARRKKQTDSKPMNAVIFLFVLVAVAVVFFFPDEVSMPEPLATPVPSEPGEATAPPAPTGATWYEVYFTTPLYPDDKAAHTGSIDEKLAAFIDSATSTVDMAIYQLDAPPVVQALNDALERDVTVRIVTSTEVMEDEDESADFVDLADAGVEVVDGNPNAIMHNKFVVVDGQAVWTGSWNFTAHDTYRYNNNGIIVRSPDLAANYTATFEKMWNDGLFGRQRDPGGTTPILTIEGTTVENYFSPEDETAEAILMRLNGAQESIHFMAFSFTDDQMGAAILERAENGVEVRGIFENTGSNTEYSEYGGMRVAELDVLQDGNPYLMHHKVFIIDS